MKINDYYLRSFLDNGEYDLLLGKISSELMGGEGIVTYIDQYKSQPEMSLDDLYITMCYSLFPSDLKELCLSFVIKFPFYDQLACDELISKLKCFAPCQTLNIKFSTSLRYSNRLQLLSQKECKQTSPSEWTFKQISDFFSSNPELFT